MDNTQNLGQPVGKVTTTYNGEKIQVNVYADRSVILPDGTVRKVKQEVVDALIAKNQAMNPAFDDAGTTASGAAVTHSDYANVNDTEAYLIESDEGNVMAFTNNADLLTSVLGLQ